LPVGVSPARFERLQRILALRQPDLTVLMDRFEKPHNFSAILRTCDAVGVPRAHLVSAEDFRPRRTAAGGVGRYVRVRRHASLDDALRLLRQDGFAIVAAHPQASAMDFRAVDFTGPTALLLGPEKEGLSPVALDAADRVVRIPMLGAVTSLNVSVAAAVILYEAQRQRMAAGLYEAARLDPAAARQTLFEWAYPRIAALCRRRDVPYPALGPDGQILGELPR
jgi:tRNA (guanosine-2'-O-)-methyltransferase